VNRRKRSAAAATTTSSEERGGRQYNERYRWRRRPAGRAPVARSFCIVYHQTHTHTHSHTRGIEYASDETNIRYACL